MSDIAEILLPTALDHGFDYRLPEGLDVPDGTLVSAPLGGRSLLGVVWGKGKGEVEAGKIKPVKTVHGGFPPFSAAFRKFLAWVAWYNATPLGAVVKMALPIAEIDKPTRTRAHIEALSVETITQAKLSREQEASGRSGAAHRWPTFPPTCSRRCWPSRTAASIRTLA